MRRILLAIFFLSQLLSAQPVMAFPKAPPLLFSDYRLQRCNYLRIADHGVDPRPVVRRPRQPGCLASANDWQTVLLGHDADRFALG